jgi:CHAT domain-containing protein/tetratricopeptide (TPR) repeat protein
LKFTGVSAVAAVVALMASAISCARDAEPPVAQFAELDLIPQDSITADSLIGEGEAAYFRGEYDSADVLLTRGGGGARANGDSAAYARSLTWLGLSAWRQGRYRDAQAAGERALGIKLRLGYKEDLFRSHNALGLLAHNEGRFATAEKHFRDAAEAATAVHDSVSIAKAIGNLGLVYADAGEFDKARAAFLTLRAAANRADDPRSEGNALANLGMLDIRSGQAGRALESLAAARVLYTRIGHPPGIEAVLGQTGSAYDAMGDPERALVYLDSALEVARKHDLLQPAAENLQIIGELLGEAGDHSRALSYLAQARSFAESAGLGSRLGDIQRAEAREYASLSQFDRALARARGAAESHRSAGARLDELNDQLLYAEIAQRSGRAADADGALKISQSLASKLNFDLPHLLVSIGRARVADLAGNPRVVLETLGRSGDDFERLGASSAWEVHALRARAYARLRRWEDAAGAGRLAVAGAERVRSRLPEGPMRASYAADKAAVYSDLIISLLRLGKTEEAFEVADASRGRALLERLGTAAGEARSDRTIDLADSERLLRRIGWLVEQLRNIDTVPPRERGGALREDVAALSRALATSQREYEEKLQRAGTRNPGGSAILGATPVSLRQVMESLASGEVLLSFHSTARSLVTFVVTRGGVRSFEAPLAMQDLATRSRLAVAVLGKAGNDPSRAVLLNELHDALVLPAQRAGLIGRGQTVLVVPPPVLGALPFGALVDDRGRYLVESHAVVILPSAAALPVLRNRANRNNGAHVVLAPFPRELPGTGLEAGFVARGSPGSQVFLSSFATEGALRVALETSAVVHVASHSVLNHASPMFSRVELAKSGGKSPGDDGRLEVHEVISMPVRSGFVFLSGCESGAGTAWSTSFKQGQDYTTLAQAFLYAGARDVVSTLWRIDDAGASEFARKFYSALPNRTVAEALAVAQRQMISDPRYSSPRFWAAYTLAGSGVTRISPQTGSRLAVQ